MFLRSMSPADDKPKGALPLFAPAPWPGVLAATQTGVLDDALGMMPVRGACAKRRGCADRLPGLCPESMGVGSFGQVKFDDQRKALAQPLAVTPWCSADCKLGCVAVNLDFAQVFGCEVYASDAGFASFGPEYDEQKLNVGLRVCRSLFRCSCVLVLVVPPWRCTPLRRPGERVGVMPRALRLRQTAARRVGKREAGDCCVFLLLASLLLPSPLTMPGWWVDAGAQDAKMAAQVGETGGMPCDTLAPTRTTSMSNSTSAWTTTFLSPSVSS